MNASYDSRKILRAAQARQDGGSLQFSRDWGNEEKREAGGQGEFSVNLAVRRDVASQPAT